MEKRYRLHTENFGPIREASVEIRPLTVFVGPCNVGKSYLAGLLYSFHRTVAPSPVDVGAHSFRSFLNPRFGEMLSSRRAGEDLLRVASSWVAALVEAPPGYPDIPKAIGAHVRKALWDSEPLGGAFAREVARCFGAKDPTELALDRAQSQAPLVEVAIPHGASGDVRFRTQLGSVQGPPVIEIPEMDLGVSLELRRSFAEDAFTLGDAHTALRFLMEVSFRQVFGPPAQYGAYYLPAGRAGVMHSHPLVTRLLYEGASLAGILDGPVLSGVVADFLGTLLSRISQLEGRPSRATTGKLAGNVEDRILDGRILVKTGEVRYPAFSYQPLGSTGDLPLIRASSMVSELAPVVLYLRYIVRPGDLLIIEEPESHLHPAKQTAFVRELAAIANAGVRIVLTTHSEWFMEQIGNLVRSSELPAHKQKFPNEALQADDVGVWLFRDSPDGKGSSVSEIKVDPETGLFPTDFGPVSDALYNEHAAIFNALESDADE